MFVLSTCFGHLPFFAPKATFTSLLLASIQKFIPRVFGHSCKFFCFCFFFLKVLKIGGSRKLYLCWILFLIACPAIWKKHVTFDILHRMNVFADEVPGYYKLCESVPLLFNCAICIWWQKPQATRLAVLLKCLQTTFWLKAAFSS